MTKVVVYVYVQQLAARDPRMDPVLDENIVHTALSDYST